MPERLEKSPHRFWMETCGIDTRRRSANHARLDTPWNAFSQDQILVCTLWSDEILRVFDDVENRTREFVKIGGKRRRWKGPAIQHGMQAAENLQRAFKERLRVVGFEAEPSMSSEGRSIAHYYMDRRHELERMTEFSHGDMVRRLKLEEQFAQLGRNKGDIEISPGIVFELVEQKGSFPAANLAQAGDDDLAASGNLSNEAYARTCIPILIAHVLKQRDEVLQTMTYTELAALLGRRNKHGEPYPRGLGDVLGQAMTLIDGVADQVGTVPYLTTIVVQKGEKSTALPGDGVAERWPDYVKMTPAEKTAKVLREHIDIVRYGTRWNDILTALQMARIDTTIEGDHAAGGRNGGESAAHKALKAYVRSHPEEFGADSSWDAFEEYPLRSGDTIDVFFKSQQAWIGVEVKSAVSDSVDADYQRGLFQVVKYDAVLKAQIQADQPDVMPTVKVLLVLESRLPATLQSTAQTLQVEVREQCGCRASSLAFATR